MATFIGKPIQWLTLLSLFWLMELAGSLYAQSSYESDVLYEKGKYREALAGYQQRLRSYCASRKLTTTKPELFYSSANETESDPVLRAQCLFEKGAYSLLQKDNAAAVAAWIECRDLLKDMPVEGNFFYRRVVAALFIQQLPSCNNLDKLLTLLNQFAPVCESYPLPEHEGAFRSQLKVEYLGFASLFILEKYRAISMTSMSEANSYRMTTASVNELLSRKSLYEFLGKSNEDLNTSHEALLDRVVFGPAFEPSFDILSEQLLAVGHALKRENYAQGTAFLTLWASESTEPIKTGLIVYRQIGDGFPWGDFLQHCQQIAQVAEDLKLPITAKRFLGALSIDESRLNWSDETGRCRFATLFCRYGYSASANQMLRSILKKGGDSPLYNEARGITVSILYNDKKYSEAVQLGEELASIKGYTVPPQVLHVVGLCCAKIDKMDQAIDYLKRFVEVAPQDPDVPETMYFLAQLYLSKGQRADAVELFKNIVSNYPESSISNQSKLCLLNLKVD